MLGFDALGRLALGQLPSIPLALFGNMTSMATARGSQNQTAVMTANAKLMTAVPNGFAAITINQNGPRRALLLNGTSTVSSYWKGHP